MAADIIELGFKSSVRPELNFEIMTFSELSRRTLPHALRALTRPSFFIVYYGRKGRTRHRVDFEQCEVSAHRVAFVAPGRVQAFDPQPGLELDMLLFAPEFLQPSPVDPLRGSKVLSPFWMPPVLTVPPAEREELIALLEQLRREYTRPKDGVQAGLLSALLRAFLLRCERLAGAQSTGSSAPALLETFRTRLEQDHASTRSVDDYARALGVTARALNQLTRKHFGKSAKQTIDERVVLELKRQLAYTGLSVKELTARFGFDEPTNLVKFFRKHAGVAPIGWRERFR